MESMLGRRYFLKFFNVSLEWFVAVNPIDAISFLLKFNLEKASICKKHQIKCLVTTSYLVLIYLQTAPATIALRQSALPGSFHSKVEILPTDVSNCNEQHTK